MQLNLKLALTLTLSPRRGKALLMRWDRSRMGDFDSRVVNGSPSPVRRERAGVRVLRYCIETA
jgi:hypothetical protein